jgi:hypothetical protein
MIARLGRSRSIARDVAPLLADGDGLCRGVTVGEFAGAEDTEKKADAEISRDTARWCRRGWYLIRGSFNLEFRQSARSTGRSRPVAHSVMFVWSE